MRYLIRDGKTYRQQGLVLIIVLVALVSLSLAAVGLIRSIDTGTMIMGNLGFKQATTSAADSSAETAMGWISSKLSTTPTDLYDSRCSSGCATQDSTAAYYATSLDALDISGHSASATRALVDWNGDGCAYATSGTYATCLKASVPVVANGISTRFIIARMCKTTGDPNGSSNNCAQPTSTGAVDAQINKGEIKYGMTTMLSGNGGGSGTGTTTLLFRVVVRAVGARNTVSYTETYVSAVAAL